MVSGVEVTLVDDTTNLLKNLYINATTKVQPAVLSVKKLSDFGEFQGKLWAVDTGWWCWRILGNGRNAFASRWKTSGYSRSYFPA